MNLVSKTCDKCGADLKVDLSQGFAYCQHCGNKLYADYSNEVLIEKEKTKQKEFEFKSEVVKRTEPDIYRPHLYRSLNKEERSDIIFYCTMFLYFSIGILIILLSVLISILIDL